MSQAGEALTKSITSIPEIFMDSVNHWPAAISFAAVGYIESMVLANIPNPGGTSGMLLAAFARGWTQVVSMATWDNMRTTRYDIIPDMRGFMRGSGGEAGVAANKLNPM